MAEPTAAPATPAVPVAAAPAAPVAPKVEAPKADVAAVDENGVATSPKKVWKLKVNDKEIEYDASDESRIQRDIQKVIGIEEKAKNANQKAAEAEALVDMLQNKPLEFAKRCKAAGINAEKLATDILYDIIRRNSMTPEQRELEEYKEREREAEDKRVADEQAAKVASAKQATQEWAAKFEKDCETALKSNQIPKTRLALALVAQYIDSGLAQKKEYSVEQVLPWVKRDLQEIHISTIGKLDGEELLNYIGEEMSNKIAKARVDRYKKSQVAPQAAPQPKQAGTTPKSTQDRLKGLKGKAYWAEMRRIKSEEGIDFYPGKP